MKSTKEIIVLLVHELINHFDKTKSLNTISGYYNEILGDTPFLLAGLLYSLLKERYNEWDKKKWIDDSLIRSITQNNKLLIEGVMIFGEIDNTEQWVAPFNFEIYLLNDKPNFKEFTFFFCDLNSPEITYEDFKGNRNYWIGGNKKWKYSIYVNETLI